MQQISPVEEHREQPDYERACNIYHKRRERKSPVVMLIDSEGGQIAGQRANAAAGEDEKASNQQSTDSSAPDFIAEVGTLSA